MKERLWHTKTTARIADELDTNPKIGISEEESGRRLSIYGPNALKERERRSPIFLFLGQFNDFMVWILISAAIISGFLLREITESLAITAILFINAVLGFVQEYRAERAMEALKKLAAPKSRVLRDGYERLIPASELVPGDVILLEGGDVIPADGRVDSVSSFLVDEATLTGESTPSEKITEALDNPDLPLGDRENMVYLGTTVLSGRAQAIVVETGSKTEMGKIAELIQVEEEKTPLQVELFNIGKTIAVIVLAIAAIVFLVGLARGFNLIFMFLASVSLAVAAIPEGLPAIVTLTLALGVQALAAQNAIIRKLRAVETLGSTTVICTDKTGTLTLNKMTADKIYIDGHIFGIEDKRVVQEEAIINSEDLFILLMIAVLCNDARYVEDDKLIGDPTETALIKLAETLNFSREEVISDNPRVGEIPFNSRRKRMTTINKSGEEFLVLMKGAPEVVLSRCLHARADGNTKLLSSDQKKSILAVNNRLASEGYRNLAFAYKSIKEPPTNVTKEGDSVEKDLVLVGLISLTDPPRVEVPMAIETAKQAGIKVAMVTGDHMLTAVAVANRIGLLEGRKVVAGAELEEVTADELAGTIEEIGVFSRVDPTHKVLIVDAFKKRGDIVAMTGDGVNDAPAVKRADIGISMGRVGTEVTKEASDMILADDNFATIIRAVREGRLIFDNLKKFILFLISCNISEVFTVFFVLIAGLPIPLLPTQILWTNLITDGLPALALGVEPPATDLMGRPPRNIKEGVLSRPRLTLVIWQGFFLTVGIVTAYVAAIFAGGVSLFAPIGGDSKLIAVARTAAFTTMVTVQLLHSLNYRTATTTLFSKEVLKNRLLLFAIIGSFLLQLAVVYLAPLQSLFSTAPLGIREWIIIFISIIPALLLIDLTKTKNIFGRF